MINQPVKLSLAVSSADLEKTIKELHPAERAFILDILVKMITPAEVVVLSRYFSPNQLAELCYTLRNAGEYLREPVVAIARQQAMDRLQKEMESQAMRGSLVD